MKSHKINLRAVLLALLCCTVNTTVVASRAQGVASDEWVKFAPPDEGFTVVMPRAPFPLAQTGKAGALAVAGQRYRLRHDNAEYAVWSFKAEKLPDALRKDAESYLDQCAEIAWDLLVEPYWKKFKHSAPGELFKYNLAYERASPTSDYPSRSYLLNLGEERGLTHIYAVGSRVYIIAASGAPGESAGVERFVKSFALTLLPLPDAPVVVAAAGTGMGVGPGRGGEESGAGGEAKAQETNYSRTFRSSEVTQKAQMRAKPEPSYTEPARKFGVTGTVLVRAVLSASGHVERVTPISKLPHGLTQEAVKAAHKIRFEPAIKDGRPVSQYVTIEYNFNIY